MKMKSLKLLTTSFTQLTIGQSHSIVYSWMQSTETSQTCLSLLPLTTSFTVKKIVLLLIVFGLRFTTTELLSYSQPTAQPFTQESALTLSSLPCWIAKVLCQQRQDTKMSVQHPGHLQSLDSFNELIRTFDLLYVLIDNFIVKTKCFWLPSDSFIINNKRTFNGWL